jgi:ABC-2 type transport system permease protein
MFKFRSAIQKESLLLIRDKAGLAILFLMPMVLIIIISLLQDFGWNSLLSEPKIQVVLVDNDKDTLGLSIQKGLEKSGTFEVVRFIDSVPVTEEALKKYVSSGKYQMGIVIPENATRTIRQNVKVLVTKTLAGFGMINPLVVQLMPPADTITVQIYFDPAVKKAFRQAVMASVREYDLKIQSKMVFQTFNEEFSRLMPFYKPEPIEYLDAVSYESISPGNNTVEEIPNTVQHNVPAWTIFAMFFIVIPFTGSLIKEREEGSLSRL